MSSQPHDPYEAPAARRDGRPAAIFWYRVYAGGMMLIALAFLVSGVLLAFASAGPDQVGGLPLGAVATLCAVATLFVAFYAIAAFVPFKPWGWTLGLIAIALGLASATIIFAAPLLFFWFKPNVKAAFARL